jgi:hypothetical protein
MEVNGHRFAKGARGNPSVLVHGGKWLGTFKPTSAGVINLLLAGNMILKNTQQVLGVVVYP